ncbi:hypothetical protein GX411_02290 [Candidatus Fermentibacteria bacterium]|nr:hypothetical protein [Candidatus Fermentibacteria bacterium]
MMRVSSFAAVFLIAVSACGYSAEQKAVRTAYMEVVDALEDGDYGRTYDCFSSNTRSLLDDLADALAFYGTPMGADGRELLAAMLEGVDMTGLTTDIRSITVSGSAATVVTQTDDGDETLEFVLEDGAWKLDFEDLIRDAMNEGMAGSGLTVEDLLEYNVDAAAAGGDVSTGTGTAPVRITNGLGNWDIWYAYVSKSTESDWGEDRLGSSILSPGCVLTVWVDPGTYDIMLEDEDGDTYTRYGVTVGAAGYDWEATLSDMD